MTSGRWQDCVEAERGVQGDRTVEVGQGGGRVVLHEGDLREVLVRVRDAARIAAGRLAQSERLFMVRARVRAVAGVHREIAQVVQDGRDQTLVVGLGGVANAGFIGLAGTIGLVGVGVRGAERVVDPGEKTRVADLLGERGKRAEEIECRRKISEAVVGVGHDEHGFRPKRLVLQRRGLSQGAFAQGQRLGIGAAPAHQRGQTRVGPDFVGGVQRLAARLLGEIPRPVHVLRLDLRGKLRQQTRFVRRRRTGEGLLQFRDAGGGTGCSQDKTSQQKPKEDSAAPHSASRTPPHARKKRTAPGDGKRRRRENSLEKGRAYCVCSGGNSSSFSSGFFSAK